MHILIYYFQLNIILLDIISKNHKILYMVSITSSLYLIYKIKKWNIIWYLFKIKITLNFNICY